MEIVAVHLLDREGLPIIELESGDPLHIEIEYLASQPIEAPHFGVMISREDGFICYDTNTAAAGLSMPTVQGQGRIMLRLDRLDLNGGQYYVDVGVYQPNWEYAYDFHWQVYPLLVAQVGGGRAFCAHLTAGKLAVGQRSRQSTGAQSALNLA